MEQKDLQIALDALKSELEQATTKKAKDEIAAQIAAFETKHKEAIEGYTTLKAAFDELKTTADKLAVDAAANQPVIDAFVNSKNDKNAPVKENKAFNEILGETIEKNADTIRGFKRGAPEVKMRLAGYEDQNVKEVKTVGDMSITANFPNATAIIQDVRNQLIQTPYNRVWLADVLSQGTSNGNSVLYPKENGGEGGADVWTDPTQNKPQMDFDFVPETAFFKWIAGYVIVAREMLDDIPFLTSYLQNKMLVSLKTAETSFVLNGTSDTNPVTGLYAAATPYDGGFTGDDIKSIMDAGWGQIIENTNGFYNPTTAVMRPREAVRIALRVSGGSEEFDLPNGVNAFSGGTALVIPGFTTVTTTAIQASKALVLDRNAAMFIRRLQPEFRMFEDSTLALKNKVMFRIEERATLLVFNNDAIVIVDVSTS